jgi:hypothetical protein
MATWSKQSQSVARPTWNIFILLCFVSVCRFDVLWFSKKAAKHEASPNTEWQGELPEWADAGDVAFPCTIDVVDVSDFSVPDFLANYMNKKSLVIRGGADFWPAAKLWTKSFMREQYGGTVRPVADADHPTSGESVDFRKFLDGMSHDPQLSEHSQDNSLYTFDYPDAIMSVAEWEAAVPTLRQGGAGWRAGYWDMLGRPNQIKQYVGIGPNGTGLYWHAHDSALNACIRGKRRWFVSAAGSEFADAAPTKAVLDEVVSYTKKRMSVWAESVYPSYPALSLLKSQILECVQEEGDIIYVPQATLHGVVNYGDTVAVAIQARSSAMDAAYAMAAGA